MADYNPSTDTVESLSTISNANFLAVNPNASGDSQFSVYSGSSVRSTIISGLQAASATLQQIVDLFPAAANGTNLRKRADGTGVEFGLPKLIQYGTVTGTAVSGTTDETLVATLTIPANTLEVGDRLLIEAAFSLPTGSTTSRAIRVRWGSFSGNPLLSTGGQIAAANTSGHFGRILYVTDNTTLRSILNSASSATPYGTSTGGLTATTINRAISNDLVLTAQMGATTESATLTGFFAMITKN